MSWVLENKHVLIVEDDEHIRSALQAWFHGRNTVTSFPSGTECVAAAGSLTPPDAVILDYLLPQMNGIEVYKNLKPLFPSAKFVMVTGHLDPEVAEEGQRLGFDSLILKPFDFAILEKNIAELLGS